MASTSGLESYTEFRSFRASKITDDRVIFPTPEMELGDLPVNCRGCDMFLEFVLENSSGSRFAIKRKRVSSGAGFKFHTLYGRDKILSDEFLRYESSQFVLEIGDETANYLKDNKLTLLLDSCVHVDIHYKAEAPPTTETKKSGCLIC